MSEEPTRDTAICWECDASTTDPVEVVLHVRDHSAIQLKLCSSCYRAYWMLLAVVLKHGSVAAARDAPPRGTE